MSQPRSASSDTDDWVYTTEKVNRQQIEDMNRLLALQVKTIEFDYMDED